MAMQRNLSNNRYEKFKFKGVLYRLSYDNIRHRLCILEVMKYYVGYIVPNIAFYPILKV